MEPAECWKVAKYNENRKIMTTVRQYKLMIGYWTQG